MNHRQPSNNLQPPDEESYSYAVDEKTDGSAHVENANGRDAEIICGLTLDEQKKVMLVGIPRHRPTTYLREKG